MMKGKKGVIVSRGEKRIVIVVAMAVISRVMVKGKS